MYRFWRKLAPVAVAAGLIAGSAAMPAEAATPAAYKITVAAKTKAGKVDSYTLVYYHVKGYDIAVVHGQITGAKVGDVVTLLSKPFGARHFRPTYEHSTLTRPSSYYSFTVQPNVATSYEVQVSTGKKVDVTSGSETAYVTLLSVINGKNQKCGRTRCTFWYNVYTSVPASAYKTESSKHVYLYLTVGSPTYPKVFTLSTTATATRAKRLRANEFEQKYTWLIPVAAHGTTYWDTDFCTKDTESRDGIGLPGHHHCGDKNVPFSEANVYLG